MQLPDEVLAEYELVAPLGRGGQGVAYRGRHRASGTEVVLKALDFLELSSWKDFELWQREGKVLRSLRHPAIPAFFGHFPEQVSGDSPEAVITVQEFVDGTTLETLLEESGGAVMSEAEAREFTCEMLEVLNYLHQLNPPVVHRDIKPSNIVRRPDGMHALIDFGAARSSSALTQGSTFVGTNGYMPPEQLMGRAEPRSDLFALGATVIELMTGLHPSDLIGDEMKFSLEHVEASDEFRRFLQRLVDPIPERRYASAERALEALHVPEGAMVLAEENTEGFRITRTADGAASLKLPRPPTTWLLAVGYITLGGAALVVLSKSIAMILFWIFTMVLILFPAHGRLNRIELHPDRIVVHRPLRKTLEFVLGEVVDVRMRRGNEKFSQGVVIQTSAAERNITGLLVPARARWLTKTLEAHIEENR